MAKKPDAKIEWLTLAMRLDRHKSGPIELSQRECGIVAHAMQGLLQRIETLEEQVKAFDDERPYWLLRSLASEVEKRKCSNRTDMKCCDHGLCVTEYCLPCAARWWMDETRKAEAPLPRDEEPPHDHP